VRQEAERALRQAGTFGIGRLVPINGHRMSRKRQLGLTDDNGNLHDCVAESFTTGQQVFVLIHVVKALTAKRILLGAAA
jgi:hypothetical protein